MFASMLKFNCIHHRKYNHILTIFIHQLGASERPNMYLQVMSACFHQTAGGRNIEQNRLKWWFLRDIWIHHHNGAVHTSLFLVLVIHLGGYSHAHLVARPQSWFRLSRNIYAAIKLSCLMIDHSSDRTNWRLPAVNVVWGIPDRFVWPVGTDSMSK